VALLLLSVKFYFQNHVNGVNKFHPVCFKLETTIDFVWHKTWTCVTFGLNLLAYLIFLFTFACKLYMVATLKSVDLLLTFIWAILYGFFFTSCTFVFGLDSCYIIPLPLMNFEYEKDYALVFITDICGQNCVLVMLKNYINLCWMCIMFIFSTTDKWKHFNMN